MSVSPKETYLAYSVLVDEFSARVRALMEPLQAERDRAEGAVIAHSAEVGDIEHDDGKGCALMDREEACEMLVGHMRRVVRAIKDDESGHDTMLSRLSKIEEDCARHL